MANYKLVDNWTFRRKLPEPFEDYTDDPVFKDVYSKYCNQPQKKSTLHASTLRALLAYMELEAPSGAKTPEELGAIGSQNNNFTIAEYPSKTGELHVVVYNRMNGKFTAGRYTMPPDVDSTPEKYVLKENENSGAALLFTLLPIAMADDEFNEYYQKLKEYRDDGFTDTEEAAKTAAVLCDNLYRRIRYGDSLPVGGIKTDLPANGVIPVLKPFNIQKGIYAPTNVIHGDLQVVKPGAALKKAAVTIASEDFVSKYILSDTRTLTPEEELTVPPLPPWYVIPEEIKRICEHAKLTTASVQPMRNFLLRGPSGTGKTEGSKAIAAGLHLPYRCITCSANTEIFDLLGQILPDVDGKMTQLRHTYPTFQDIALDPSTAYQKLTGIYEETVSEDDVYQKLIDVIAAEMHTHYANETSRQNFKYVDTPLVEAIRNGYVIEIQEPTVIANPGVLVGLNSLLDRCNSVFLPNGEIVTRHPDTMIVVTTNNDYAGCKQMNQSVISRMNLVIDLEEPDEETLIERVLGVTGCSDKATVRTMARIVKSISSYCKENLITDGCCGVRELTSWVQSFMICGDIHEAARYTILSSVSADPDSRSEVEGSCLDTVLAA
ncbi:AAA family ATPase [Clostridium sp. C105KSO13]|uniref:AAA family ATPase n=1 Tax=Clostridium sp. C105KSO13 TaxID=1776045 RepID=UPI0007407B6D|nr:AAA family ATPase [Clostridium sp. C105KSO13]CUX25468.1 AAA domain (dynein-related subfamily) [Clostridium sp. C105KSO13]